MRKLFIPLVVSLLLSAAAAAEFPSDGEVVVYAEGEVVGIGEFSGGDLELRLLQGFEGFATITVTDSEGNEFDFDVEIEADGSVQLNESFEDLEEVVEESGGEVEISLHEELEGGVSMAFGAGVPEHVELPEVAREGMERAKANHEAAQGRAGADASVEVGAKGEARGHGEEDADAEVDAEAGASVGVGVGLGDRN